MKSKTFENGLVVKHRRSAIFLENDKGKSEGDCHFSYQFKESEFQKFLSYIKEISFKSWKSITPKEANSLGSDYYEYYDKKYDNNGYLSIKDGCIEISAPHNSTDTLYQFNKAKIQSFIYDLEKLIKKGRLK